MQQRKELFQKPTSPSWSWVYFIVTSSGGDYVVITFTKYIMICIEPSSPEKKSYIATCDFQRTLLLFRQGRVKSPGLCSRKNGRASCLWLGFTSECAAGTLRYPTFCRLLQGDGFAMNLNEMLCCIFVGRMAVCPQAGGIKLLGEFGKIYHHIDTFTWILWVSLFIFF